MIKYYITLVLVLASTGIICGQSTQRLTAGKSNEYGLIYSLPLTAVDIYLEAELSEETPGEFSNYARRHLGISSAVSTPSRRARLLSALIVPRGVANPESRWLAQFKTGSSVYVTLSGDNIPLALNADAVSSVSRPTIPEAREAAPSPLDGPAASQAVTADMARSASVSKKAELAAQRIFELRETRSDILSGQTDNPPADGKAMQLVLDNLQAQEAALTAMFAGVRSSHTVVRKVTFMPDSTDVSGRVVARLSTVDGIIDASNLAGAPVTVSMKILERGKLPINEKGEVKTFPKGGVAYCVPGTARISVSFEGNEIASADVALAQLGVVFGLNPGLFSDKKDPYKVIFDPATGAVLELAPVGMNTEGAK